MKIVSRLVAGLTIAATTAICTLHAQSPSSPKDAEPATATLQEHFRNLLPFSDRDDFASASRGLIAPLPDGQIKAANGQMIWDMKAYDFLKSDNVPATVNPSLWRQEQLNNYAGLFKVTDGIYQIRGFDLSNMTIVEGHSGLIIIDPLISAEAAAAGLKLYQEKVAQRPVVAVIYTHSHVDHYGGVKGVVSEDDVNTGRIKIYAPAGFLEHAVEENVYAGNAMTRRALYMYGTLLPKGERGQVGTGLGKTTSTGSVTLIPPTDTIGAQGQMTETRTLDGIEMNFQLTAGTEAPAEMNIYFPFRRALCAAENATHTMHNILTLRGAQVRDPGVWAKYLDDTIDLFGSKTDVLFAQHHWPTWGTEKVNTFLADQRDMYKYINDQTLRLLNHGLTPMEIAETLKILPPSLAKKWYDRDYYGSMSHNVRAVYQRYLGFYDGNPSHLDPLPPVEASKHYVEFMGGADKVIEKAQESFKKGEYRWVAQVMDHVVFADPNNSEARELEADALEQLGYQTENGTWRSEMLMGAWELRNGLPKIAVGTTASPDTLKALTLDMFFNYMGIRLNGERADAVPEMVLNWNFTDIDQKYAVTLRNSALTFRRDAQSPKAAATMNLTRNGLNEILLGATSFDNEIKAGRIKIDGDAQKFQQLLALLDKFEVMFPIMTPRGSN